MSIRQARIANLQRQIESLDKKLMRLEEDFDSKEDDESYERTLGRRRYLTKIFEGYPSDRSYGDTTSTALRPHIRKDGRLQNTRSVPV